ncbi:hypothetical protein [Amnibacterium endophyticum]|uniref:Uncharacterized protein n=1 Tax=Amnibacterium endophyticum TaxID=2109337 RepID=A0ABW4LJ19_9MICO
MAEVARVLPHPDHGCGSHPSLHAQYNRLNPFLLEEIELAVD